MAESTIRSFNNTFFLPVFIFAIYKILLSLETKKISNFSHLLVTIGIGLSTYNRLDLFLIVFVFFMMTFSLENLMQYYQYLLDGLVGWGLGLGIDYYYYGSLKIPPINWIKFNLIENKADGFSVSRWDFYIREVIVMDGLLNFVLLNFLLLFITSLLIIVDRKIVYNDNKLIIRSYFKQFNNIIVVWLIYSSFWRELTFRKLLKFFLTGESWEPMSHKEIRFIMGGLLLLLIFFATGFEVGIILLTKFVNWIVFDIKKIKMKNRYKPEIKFWINLIIPILIIILILAQSFSFANDRYTIEQFANINHALTFVGNHDDVTGVVVAVYWYQAGPYTYSHLNGNVPIVFFNFETIDNLTLVINIKFMNSYLKNETFNYFIAPSYQFNNYPELSSTLTLNNWVVTKIFDGDVEVWKRA